MTTITAGTTGAATGATTTARSATAFSLSGRWRQRAAGERVAELFEEQGRMVYGVCRLFLRDPVEAEDAAQQTFLSAYRGLLAGQEPRDPPAWLGTIARNECRTRLRAKRPEQQTLVTVASRDDTQREAARREEIEALCAAIAGLPPQQRDAIVLRELYGLSYAEVAAALGLSGAAVESLLFRSRRRLQEQLRPVRAALGVLTLPVSLRDSLGDALPGFGGAGAGASAGAGAAVLAKVGTAPVAAKVAAATLALGTAGTIAGVETHRAHQQPRRPAPERGAPVREAHGAPQAFPPSTAPARVVIASTSAAMPRHEREHGASTRAGRRDGGDDGSGSGGHEDRSGPGPGTTVTVAEPGHDNEGPGHEGETVVVQAPVSTTTTTTTTEAEHGDRHGGDGGGGGGGDPTDTSGRHGGGDDSGGGPGGSGRDGG